MRAGVLLPVFLLFSIPAQAETRNGLLHKAESALCGTTTLPPSGTTDVGFSPGNGALNVVLRVIGSAKREIRMATYSFTSKEIAQALVDAAKRGVDVRVVVDKSQLGERYTTATFLANQRVPVRVDSRHAIAHSKYLVADGMHVETGSFNYTDSAVKRNSENAIALWNNPAMAKRYLANWASHWEHAEPLAPRY